ncbi:unnamed protein product [Amoebophrya sp. A120]|nr:unnamed protein product [Amoebophrya sp. A120]|eukprot:GSA120T00017554001.1
MDHVAHLQAEAESREGGSAPLAAQLVLAFAVVLVPKFANVHVVLIGTSSIASCLYEYSIWIQRLGLKSLLHCIESKSHGTCTRIAV